MVDLAYLTLSPPGGVVAGDYLPLVRPGTIPGLFQIPVPAGGSGTVGATGPAGVGITTATINASNHLVLTKSDGTTIDAGLVAGGAGGGVAGVGITTAAVNASGHLILTKTDATTVDAGLVVGTPGVAGTAGVQGVQGIQGIAGAAGAVAAPTAGTTVATLSASGLVYAYDAGAGSYIKFSDLLNSFGQRLTDAGTTAATALVGANKLWVSQGGVNDVAASLDQIATYVLSKAVAGASQSIALSAIASQTTGASYTVAGTLAGYASAPALYYSQDNAPFAALPGTPLITATTFSFTASAIGTVGLHTMQVKDTAGIESANPTYSVTAAPSLAITSQPTSAFTGSTLTISGTYAGAAPTGFTYAWNSTGGSGTVPTFTATGNAWAATFPVSSLVSASDTVVITGTGPNTSSATSAAISVASPTITVAAPAGWIAGGSGSISGTYTGPAPTGVSYVYDALTAYAATTAFTASGGAWSGTVPYPAAGSHTITVQEVNAAGVSATSAAFTVAALAVATAYTTALSSASGAVGNATTMTFTPTGGNWPASEVITPSAVTVTGTFSPTTASPTGNAAATVTFTPSAAGSGTLGSSAAPTLTNTSGSLAYSAAAAPAVGPTLAMINPTYDTTAAKFGQALSGGSGSAAVTWPAGSSTMECWFKGTVNAGGGGIANIFSDTGGGNGIAVDSSGIVTAYVGGYRITTTTVVTDGVFHHLALVWTLGVGTVFYVDGVSAGTQGYAAHVVNPTLYISAAGTPGHSTPDLNVSGGLGEIDEAAVFNGAKYTAAFTPPTAPYTSATPNLVAAWHLDGNGVSA